MSISPHKSGSMGCCTEAVVQSLCSLLRLTEDFKNNSITLATIGNNFPPALMFAKAQGHVVGELDKTYIIRRARMVFTIRQDEAQKLDGREGVHEPWLREKKSELFTQGCFWDNYRRLLEPRIAETPRNRLDDITDDILDDLEDPTREGQWDRRGLVIGSVQAGKTGNYIGLICKAADAGYKVIVVLAGMHNNLRAQTQFRIDEGFSGRDTREGADSVLSVGVGLEQGNRPVFPMTSAQEDGDFKESVAATYGFNFRDIEHPTVFVVKKNVSILENLHSWIQANADTPEGHERIAECPLLMIDDEADSASINTANQPKDPELDPTKTNWWIRRILNSFDQIAYVGYTATPFANIFIDEQAEDPDVGEDLFPRSFIYSIPPPSNYVGAERVFGLTDPDDEGETPELGVVKDVNDAQEWIPDRHKSDLVVLEELFPDSLQETICAFVLSCAARRVRGQGTAHKSMLVHVTPYVAPQQQVRDQVSDYLHSLKNEILFDRSQKGAIWGRLRGLWDSDFRPLAVKLSEIEEPSPVHSFDEVATELAAAVGKIEVRMINGSSTDALDYHKHAASGLSTIVIGGAKLSRGLTLEGLSVSYYLRSTRMYDTLMQMGRWFGYRPGYLDLCRVYTTPLIADSYRNIAIASVELLREFEAMQAEGKTPADFGLKVRHSPGMLVTSHTKMRHGIKRRVSFSNSRPEVTSLSVLPEERAQNLDHMSVLVEALDRVSDPKVKSPRIGWFGVPAQVVIDYFEGLAKSKLYQNARANPSYLADYIKRRNQAEGLVTWTVVLKSKVTDDSHTLGSHDVGLHERSHKGSTTLGNYFIGSLIGSADERYDLSDAERQAAEANPLSWGKAYRAERPASKGLLILYLLEGKDIKSGDPTWNGDPFAAYCVSFPFDPAATTIEYMVNNIFDQESLL